MRRLSSHIGAAEDQNLHQLLKDVSLSLSLSLGDARAVASERMIATALGQQGFELLAENGLLLMYGGSAGTGALLCREA
jgi:hypothetical protein